MTSKLLTMARRIWKWMLALCALWLALPNASAAALDSWTTYTFPQVWLPYCWTNGGPSGGPNYTNTPHLWKVVFHKGAFVAAGTGPCAQDTDTVVLRSTDGINWLKATGSRGVNGFYGMTTSPDYVMGVGWGSARSFSSNGLYWVLMDDIFGAHHLKAVAYGEGRYVAVGHDFFSLNTGRIIVSANGFNWSAATFSIFNPNDGFIGVAFGESSFRAITPTRTYSSDTNGTNFVFRVSSVQNRLICFGNDRFIRVGNQLDVSTNTAPSGSWILVPWPTAIPFDRISFGAGLFVATAGRDVASSTDGFGWTVYPNALPQLQYGSVFDVTYGNGVFMAVAGTNYYVSQPIAELRHGAVPGTLWLGGLPNRQYDIMGTNQITASNWPVLDRVTLTNSPQLWTDTNAPPQSGRFYRSRLVP